MTWPEHVAKHTDDPSNPDDRHWLRFTDPGHLRCHNCDVTLVLPLRLDLAPTPAPPKWHPPADGTPMPGWFRERVNAELQHRKESDR